MCSQLLGLHLLALPARKPLWFDGSQHTIHTSPAVISDMWLRLRLSERNRKWFYWVHTYIWKTEGSPRECTQSPCCLSHMCMLNRPYSCYTSPQLQPEETTKTNGANCAQEAPTKSASRLGKQWVSQRKCEPWDLKLPGWVTSTWPKPAWGITPKISSLWHLTFDMWAETVTREGGFGGDKSL